MEKSIYSREYKVFLEELRNARERSSLTQAQLAEKLGMTQSMISKMERGERRIDAVELRHICRALGTSLIKFITALDRSFPTD